MKNIHLIKTDNPSRLHLGKSGLVLCDLVFNPTTINSQNIYITDNSEIKEGDWVLGDFPDNPIGKVISKYGQEFTAQSLNGNKHGLTEYDSKKIILTTDDQLIQNGVQAIDDEFLQWFVKNPSCERVEISYGLLKPFKSTEKGYMIHLPDNGGIIEPKESAMDKDSIDKFFDSLSDNELKEKWNKYNKHSEQENSVTISEFIKNIKQEGYICPHTKIQCDDECCLSVEDCHLLASIDILSEPKQQSLTYSEASKKEERIFNSNIVIKEMKQWKNFVINGLKNLIKVNKPSVRKS
jgi:hypothetical protein